MKGLELSYEYYRHYGEPMLWTWFPAYADRIACGLVGEGSECFGFDDEYSQDHDFGPGFCLWLTDEDERSIGDALRFRYGQLPAEFCGFRSRPPASIGDGAQRVGVMRTSEFYERYTGLSRAPQTLAEWRRIPETFLATAVNGRVFTDKVGHFTDIRNALISYYPDDVRIKKLSTRIAVIAQAGQYNYARLRRRGEDVGALLALGEALRAVASAVYLLNRRYMPYYKWAHRGIRDLDRLTDISKLMSEAANATDAASAIEQIAAQLIAELKRQGLSNNTSDFLLDHCGELIDKIADPQLRALPVFAE